MAEKIYDVIGIGVGPFNLSLACLLHPIKSVDSLFLDKNAAFHWHPGMMLENAHLQTPFLSDLVTLADPTSPFSFLNYLKEQGRIYAFYIRENFFLLRSEYNRYCQWAISKLDTVKFNTHVGQIHYSDSQGYYVIQAWCMETGQNKTYRARKLVLGTGTTPYVPACCQDLAGQAIHSSHYLPNKKILQSQPSITVLGSGQSAAEIFYDLLQDIDVHGYELSWMTRSARFFPLEYSKLTLEMTSPDYVEYFYRLPASKRESLIATQKNLYKGINGNLINDIFDLLYVKRLNHDIRVNLSTHSDLQTASFQPTKKRFDLIFMQEEQGVAYRHSTAGLVLATGYQYQPPVFVTAIASRIHWDTQGRFAVNRNYSIDHNGNEIFVQNVGLHTHGFVTPDLGMVCHRNASIIKTITGVEHYPIEQRIACQEFTVPAEKIVRAETCGAPL